jgi:hypothetical protein
MFIGEAVIDSKEGVGAGERDIDGRLFLLTVPPVESGGNTEEGVEGVAMFIVGGTMTLLGPARFVEVEVDGLSYISVNLFNFSNASSYIRSSLALRSPTVGKRRTVSIKLCHSCVLAVELKSSASLGE